jgi:(R,R)-butanediol dehydrogenase/meso-butanediol dehydrogenase/diacetyl reductase
MAGTMPAAVYVGDGRIEVHDVETPTAAPGEVLVEVSHCGICGTDLHLVRERYARPGSVLGHEWAGTIAATGDGVTGWNVGDRIVAGPRGGCGTCYACRRNRPSVCRQRAHGDLLGSGRGAYSRFVTVDAARLLVLPDSLPTRTAALTEPTAIALHTVSLSGVQPGDRVLVTGGGPVGLLTTAVLRAHGIDDVTLSEPAKARRERALAVGARRVVEPSELHAAPMGRPMEAPFDIAFECSGVAAAAEAALDQLDEAGTFVFVGTGHEWPRVNHNRAIIFELTLIGAYNYNADGFAGAVALLDSGALPLDELIERDDIALDQLGDTMERLAHGEIAGKVMVRPTTGG